LLLTNAIFLPSGDHESAPSLTSPGLVRQLDGMRPVRAHRVDVGRLPVVAERRLREEDLLISFADAKGATQHALVSSRLGCEAVATE